MYMQNDKTLDYAEELAQKREKYSLLLQIKIDKRKDNLGALNIIDRDVRNAKAKVEFLK